MDQTQATAALMKALRAWLRARPEPLDVQGVALAYELAALVARYAETIPQATTLVELWSAEMKDQIREYGVRVEHP